MSNYQDLKVWKKSRTLVAEVYKATRVFPRSEIYGLTSQMRRAALSIAANIAEGHGRWTRRDCRSFLLIARGSAHELETELLIAEDLEFLSGEHSGTLRCATNEIGRMLSGLIRYYSA